jgi:hypothetical protein
MFGALQPAKSSEGSASMEASLIKHQKRYYSYEFLWSSCSAHALWSSKRCYELRNRYTQHIVHRALMSPHVEQGLKRT